MVLAAQYESWSLPGAIIMIVPMCLLAAIAGMWVVGSDNNIFSQIGLIVLIGLAAKNAILIVEFAKQLQDQGMPRFEAIVESSKTRHRPILMTSFAFILGALPLIRGAGAGAGGCASRSASRCSPAWSASRCSASLHAGKSRVDPRTDGAPRRGKGRRRRAPARHDAARRSVLKRSEAALARSGKIPASFPDTMPDRCTRHPVRASQRPWAPK